MLPFAVERQLSDQTARITVRGELDVETGPRLEQELRGAESDRPEALILDLRGVSFFDSTGLQIVLDADVRAREEGRAFIVLPGDGEPLRVLFVGDSSAAGVGVTRLRESLVVQSCRMLSQKMKAPVCWQLVAKSGLNTQQAFELVRSSALEPADVKAPPTPVLGPPRWSVRGLGTDSQDAENQGRYQIRHDMLENWPRIGVVMQAAAIEAPPASAIATSWSLASPLISTTVPDRAPWRLEVRTS